jgi:hypothetical protein
LIEPPVVEGPIVQRSPEPLAFLRSTLENGFGELRRVIPKHLFAQSIQRLWRSAELARGEVKRLRA